MRSRHIAKCNKCETQEGVFHKRLTLMRRQTQPATHNMLAMTPHKPPLTNVTIDVTTDPQTNGATVQPIAAMCVREVYDQSVLQFTINHKVCFALPRYTSRVIHRSKFSEYAPIPHPHAICRAGSLRHGRDN